MVTFVRLYRKISHGKRLFALRLINKNEKYISTYTSNNLAKVVLKNNVSEFYKKTFREKRGIAVGTKFELFYIILLRTEIGEGIHRKGDFVNIICGLDILVIYFSFGSIEVISN